jgi:DNA (cytosine-5)-methyltransferase 1
MSQRVENQSLKLRALDLFCGCGGFSYGFEQAGIKIVAGNDIWDIAGKTFAKNHRSSEFICGDIRSRNVSELLIKKAQQNRVNVIIGGPPCQAYSMAGARNVDDERGHLFEAYVSLVEMVRPIFFIMENVSGILTMRHDKDELSSEQKYRIQKLKNLEKKRSDLMLLRKRAKNTIKFEFGEGEQAELDKTNEELAIQRDECSDCRELVTEKILRSFNEIGYRVKFKLLNSANFGAPQKRERVIFIGTEKNSEITFPAETHSDPYADKDIELFESNKKNWVTVRETISDLENKREGELQAHWFTEHSPEFVERIKNTKIGSSIYGGYSDAWYRNPPDEPSRTVKENHGGVLVHYKKHRVMTPRELARLQTFPDKFEFEGSKADVLVQIGNAVPPLLGLVLGNHIRRLVSNKGTKTKKRILRTEKYAQV